MNAAAIIMPKTARFLFGPPPPPPSEPSSSSSTTTILGSMDQIFDLPSYEVVLFIWDFIRFWTLITIMKSDESIADHHRS
jgi:hypothetical protein